MRKKRTAQRTLRRVVTIEGYGLSSGLPSTVSILPSGANTGISFMTPKGIIGADLSCLGDSSSSTILERGECKIDTVEHLLSCLYGLFIDNVTIRVSGGEIPIGDGSARIFYDAINEVGIKEIKDSMRVTVPITERVVINGKNKSISVNPSSSLPPNKLTIKYSLDWHPVIKNEYTYVHTAESYKDIAFARTFAQSSHIKNLRRCNGAKGVKVGKNCINIDNKTAEKSDEYVRHKILDLLGDLCLMHGLHIEGSIIAVNAGHKLHYELVKGILE